MNEKYRAEFNNFLSLEYGPLLDFLLTFPKA